MTDKIKMNAWLLTWIVLPETKEAIAAILSSHKSENQVIEIVELLYVRSTFSAFHMAYYANRRKDMPHKPQIHANYIICGANPCWLYARRVTNLEIQIDKENEREIVSWTEPPSYKFKNYTIDEVIEGEKRHWERKYFSPLSKDTWRFD